MATILHCPFNMDAPFFYDTGPYDFAFSPGGTPARQTATFRYGGASLSLNGSSYLTISYSSFMELATALTVECWVYLTALKSGNQAIVERWLGDSSAAWRLCLNSLGQLFSSYRTAAGVTTITGTGGAITLGAWNHCAFVKSAGGHFLYINGVLTGSNTDTSPLAASTNDLQIGRNEDQNTWYFTGCIDDLRISDEALYTEAFTPPGAIGYTTPAMQVEVMPGTLQQRGADIPDPLAAAQIQGVTAYDLYFGGTGTISGTTKVKSSPSNIAVARRVRLYEKRSGILVRETWSDATGNYTFQYLNTYYTYYVTAFDHTNTYEAVAADNLVPTT